MWPQMDRIHLGKTKATKPEIDIEFNKRNQKLEIEIRNLKFELRNLKLKFLRNLNQHSHDGKYKQAQP